MTADARPFTAQDAWSFNEGSHVRAHDVLGAHPDGAGSVSFRVWAPNARRVQIVGDMNGWSPRATDELEPDPSGVWRGACPADIGQRYKFRIHPAEGEPFDKADPYAAATVEPPDTASVIADLAYVWGDDDWMASRAARLGADAPVSIYEVHLGSWRYEPGGYRALARQLVDYVTELGFTHVEVLPVTEHPFYGSWGYQTTGYFAPTARYGTPGDLMAMIDEFHQADIGVILDWVPSHFPDDAFGLARFDGSHLYEHADPRLGHHPDWDSCIFNYGRAEVRSFLLSSAHSWAERFHIDGLRVDAVASMLYRDYSREEGQWLPNEHGGNENLEAVSLLQDLNRTLGEHHPDVVVMAEESTAWPGVTRSTDEGGLGFGYKWDMGWMHDTLQFFHRDPIHRGHHLNELTFRAAYASSERYVLPLSHDEVVHGKGALLEAMPGDAWQKRANLRLLYGYQWSTPGKKLLFMGNEFGQPREWDHERELDWELLADPDHNALLAFVTELNWLYRTVPALHLGDHREDGFSWVIGDDERNAVGAYLRTAEGAPPVLVVANFTPVVRDDYRVGVPVAGTWQPLLESDAPEFGGSGVGNFRTLSTEAEGLHGFSDSLRLRLGPLSIAYFTPHLDERSTP